MKFHDEGNRPGVLLSSHGVEKSKASVVLSICSWRNIFHSFSRAGTLSVFAVGEVSKWSMMTRLSECISFPFRWGHEMLVAPVSLLNKGCHMFREVMLESWCILQAAWVKHGDDTTRMHNISLLIRTRNGCNGFKLIMRSCNSFAFFLLKS